MREAARVAPFIAITRDRSPGRITIDREGKAVIGYQPDKFVRNLLTRAMVESVRIHRAAGAYRIGTLHTPFVQWREGEDFGAFVQQIQDRGVVPNRIGLFSAHQMGTCNIGADRKRSVADPTGKVWGFEGLYVADASALPNGPGVNPMLTVMALARRTAQLAAEEGPTQRT
jgi:choline dehydrogenase-like flavoprotein